MALLKLATYLFCLKVKNNWQPLGGKVAFEGKLGAPRDFLALAIASLYVVVLFKTDIIVTAHDFEIPCIVRARKL
jgi:hypothetical protein